MTQKPGWKPFAFGVLALAGLAGAVWSVYSFTGAGRGEVLSPERAMSRLAPEGQQPRNSETDAPSQASATRGPSGIQTGQTPDWINDAATFRSAPGQGWDLPSQKNASDAALAIDTGLFGLDERLSETESLKPLLISQRESATRAWRGFIQPLVAGDRGAFLQALDAFGIERGDDNPTDASESGQPDPASQLFDRLVGFYEGGSVGLTHTTARMPDASDPSAIPAMPSMPGRAFKGIPSMRMRSETRDDATGESAVADAVLMPVVSVFPEAQAAMDAGAPVIELVCPVRMKGNRSGAPDLVSSVFLVLCPRDNAWRPVALRQVLLTERATDALPSGPRP